MQKKCDRLLLSALILIAFTIPFVNGCGKSKPKSDLSSESKRDLSSKTGYGNVPFFRKGSLAFLSRTALQEMENRKKKAEEKLKKQKEEFQAVTKGRFKNTEDVYWVPPPPRIEQIKELEGFPKDAFDYLDFTVAVKRGYIDPADSIYDEEQEKEEVFTKDILLVIKDRIMANVMFSHKTHSYWLSCKNCHPGIFLPKKGANKYLMQDIWDGKYCGRCHGSVAFQPKGFENCIRCHSEQKKRFLIR